MKVEARRIRARGPILEPPTMMANAHEHRGVASEIRAQGGGPQEASAAVPSDIERATPVNRTSELFPGAPLRRGRAGLGHKPPVLVGRQLRSRETWDGVGYPAHAIQVLSWKVGSLQSITRADTLNDLVA